jgi:hypothetical protein
MATRLRHPEESVEVPTPQPRIGTAGAVLLVAGGAIGAVLAMLGLVNVIAPTFDGIALIILGATLMLAGTLFRSATAATRIPSAPGVPGKYAGFLAEILLGAVAGVLGLLLLARVGTVTLAAFGVIALGLGLWMGSSDLDEFDRAIPRSSTQSRKPFDESAGVDVLFGITAVALGILAWIGVARLALPRVAEIGVGAALILIGLVLARRRSRVESRG